MLKRGIKEVRDHFTQYVRMVKMGKEILITEREKPVALISPIPKGTDFQEKLELAAMRGLIRLPQKNENIPHHKKIKLKGKSLTDIILEEREAGW